MLTVFSMHRRFLAAATFCALGAGCAAAKPEPAAAPRAIINVAAVEEPAPRRVRAALPPEAKALSHFLKGQLMLQEGDFNGAIAEFASAAEASPNDAFLHFRLATLYLRRGDLKRALSEAEAATALEPQNVENRLLLAGLYASLGDTQKGTDQYNEVLKIDPKNK
jgi:tetratricopeptide (TPR) repeat protein